jgi:hypothetical protein
MLPNILSLKAQNSTQAASNLFCSTRCLQQQRHHFQEIRYQEIRYKEGCKITKDNINRQHQNQRRSKDV